MTAVLVGAGVLIVVFMGLFLWALLTTGARADRLFNELRKKEENGG